MGAVLDIAKLSSKGQITIPVAIRRRLGIDTGDKLVFVEQDDGSVGIRNATIEAFVQARQAFAGAANEAGLATEDDVVAMIKEHRKMHAGGSSRGGR